MKAGAPTVRKKGAVVAALMVGLAVSPGAARTMQQKMEAACASDVQRLCPGEADGPDAVKACLLRQRGAVSERCIALVDASE